MDEARTAAEALARASAVVIMEKANVAQAAAVYQEARARLQRAEQMLAAEEKYYQRTEPSAAIES